MKKFIVAIFLFNSLVYANWSAVNKIDDFTDKKVLMAIWDDKKHHIQISRYKDDVWMYISIKGIEQFNPNGLIEMRVDKNSVKKINFKTLRQINSLGIKKVFEWKPSVVAFDLILLSKGCGYLDEMINGKNLKIRYTTSLNMSHETFSVPLDGFYKVLVDGLNIKECKKINY